MSSIKAEMDSKFWDNVMVKLVQANIPLPPEPIYDLAELFLYLHSLNRTIESGGSDSDTEEDE